jgi:Xaa-Pro aminopeptidase
VPDILLVTRQPAVALCRTVKIPEEVACLRYANHISGGGHEAIWEAAAGGSQWEYELEAAFVGHTLRHGLRHLGYARRNNNSQHAYAGQTEWFYTSKSLAGTH